MAKPKGKEELLFPAKIALLLTIPSLFLFIFFNIWPIAFSVYLAFTNANQINVYNPEYPARPLRFIGLSNFVQLFNDPAFYYSLLKTLLFLGTSVPLKMLVGVGLAFLFSSPLIYGKRVMRGLLLTPWALPAILSVMIWRGALDPRYGPMTPFFSLIVGRPFQAVGTTMNEWDSFLAYNIIEMWLAYPFVMTVVGGAISGIPKEIIEASIVDGAGVFSRTTKVVLPLIMRTVAFVAVLTSGASLQAFLIPFVLNDGGPMKIFAGKLIYSNDLLLLYGYHRFMRDYEWGYAAAFYLIVVMILSVYVYIWFKFVFQRGGK
jgi:arabinogalactan oligomer/maltooligosaccharide transport system permease protein